MIVIKSASFDRGIIFLNLNNDTIIGTPIHWHPNRQWIHWEELDEDLGLEHFLRNVNTDPEK